MDVIPIVPLDVWINDSDHLPSVSCNLFDHIFGVWEGLGIPREILLSVGVFNIKPNDIVGDIMFFELSVNRPYIVFILVVPTALLFGSK